MHRNTKLAIMPILPTLCVCEKPKCICGAENHRKGPCHPFLVKEVRKKIMTCSWISYLASRYLKCWIPLVIYAIFALHYWRLVSAVYSVYRRFFSLHIRSM